VRDEIVARPTRSVAAYDAFLKGEATAASGTPADSRRAIAYYQDAIRLDSTFVLAWARLSSTAGNFYRNFGLTQIGEIARAAAERARQLAPTNPETFVAQATYEAYVQGDPPRALATAEAGLRVAPNNPDLLTVAATQEQTLGRFEDMIPRLEHAFAIDPRSATISRRLGYAFMVTRRFGEARTALQRGLTLAPGNQALQQNLAVAALGEGDVETVRRIGDAPSSSAERDRLLAYLAQYDELGWALDRSQQDRVLQLGPELFDDDRAAWAMVRANLYYLRGDRTRTRAWADTAKAVFEQQAKEAPDDAQRAALHGVALAYLGRYQEAISEGKRGLAMLPPSKDAYFGTYVQHQLIRIYLLAGRKEEVLDLLEPLLAMPYTLTPAWVRVDPTFEPIRDTPRFRKLVEGTA
jgi:tetratricopeptide (TPR) repeat protein